MQPADPQEFNLKKMLADYMENGLLDNILDMFKHDASLYAFVGDLMTDERMRVRIGASALLETLKQEDPDHVAKAVPFLLPLLKNPNPVLRGDAAYLLGIIGNAAVVPFLEEITNDENHDVKAIAEEAIRDIKANMSCS
jgi:HEAT repeat protein